MRCNQLQFQSEFTEIHVFRNDCYEAYKMNGSMSSIDLNFTLNLLVQFSLHVRCWRDSRASDIGVGAATFFPRAPRGNLQRVKFPRLLANPLAASSRAFMASPPKQQHSRAKSGQQRRLSIVLTVLEASNLSIRT